MSTSPKSFLTPEQYLEIERRAEFRSEYYQGEMFAMAGPLAMAGARRNHNLLAGNAFAQVHAQLRHRECEVYSNDMRVRVTVAGPYTYPDIVIACGQIEFLDANEDTLLNPTVIIEVLSASTEAYDRGKKFELYRSLDSLREYVLVSSDRIQIERYSRQAEGKWLLTAASHPEDTIELESAGCTLSLADLYERVEFSTATEGAPRAGA
jgi:Uma2 family endonuclease